MFGEMKFKTYNNCFNLTMRDVSRNAADILELCEVRVGKHIGKCFRVGVLGNTRYRDSGSHYLAVLTEAKNGAVPLGRFKSFCPPSLHTTPIYGH